MSRLLERAAVGFVAISAITYSLAAQDSTAHRPDTTSTGAGTEQKYIVQQQSTLNDLRTTEHKLAELRTVRIQLESRVDNAAAKASDRRANELLLSHETTALRSLDSVLAFSQDNLLAQRDRFLSLGEAVQRRAAAELVVVVRVDSSAQPQIVDSVTVRIDSASAMARRYSAASIDALNAGAVDEVYHSNVLPSTHAVVLSASINGGLITKAANVDVPTAAVTYVQFSVRNGQLVMSTWSSRTGTTP